MRVPGIGVLNNRVWNEILSMGFTEKTFLALQLNVQQLIILEAETITNTRSTDTPFREFERIDTPLSIYLGDWYLRHSYYRRDLRPITVDYFIREVLQLTRSLEKEMDKKDRDLHDYCFFFVSDDNRLFPLSIPKIKIASLGVEEAIKLLLKVEADRGEELFGSGSGFQVLEHLNNFSLNTGYFTVGSKKRGDRTDSEKKSKIPDVLETSSSEPDLDKTQDNRFFQRSFVNYKTVRYLGFDFETVIHRSHSYVMPYAYSLGVYNSKGKELRRYTKISTNETKVRVHLCNALQRERPTNKEEGVYLIGFNNSRFDNFLLHQSIAEHRLRYNDPFVVKGGILGLTVEDIIVKDLYRFVMAPLKKGCMDFGCGIGKGELSHWKFQRAYYDGDEEFGRYLESKEAKVREYVERDVSSMMELWFKCRDTYLEITGLYIEDHYTLASVGYAHYKKVVPKEYWNDRPKMSADLEDFVRGAVCGGRSQVFSPGDHKEEIALVDVKSQYPHEMRANEYPLGEETWTKRYHPGKIGLYEVRVGQQPEIKMVAFNGNKTTDWDYDKKFTRVVSSVSIGLMEEYGVKYEIKRGCYWKESALVFKLHMERLYKTKRKQDEWKDNGDPRYNPSLRNIVKLLMNSLSGKMVERTHTTLVSLVQTKTQLNRFLRQVKEETVEELHSSTRSLSYLKGELKEENIRRTIPTIWGVLIYEYSRARMYREVYSKMRGLIATETDSALATKKSILRHRRKYPELYGDEMGQLGVEYLNENAKAIVVSKKCLAIYDGDTKEILKATFKGVNQKSDKIITEKEYEKLKSEETKYRWYWDKSKGSPVDLDIYRQLIRGERVSILCSQLTRVLKPKSTISPEPLAHIRQVFLLKQFPRGLDVSTSSTKTQDILSGRPSRSTKTQDISSGRSGTGISRDVLGSGIEKVSWGEESPRNEMAPSWLSLVEDGTDDSSWLPLEESHFPNVYENDEESGLPIDYENDNTSWLSLVDERLPSDYESDDGVMYERDF